VYVDLDRFKQCSRRSTLVQGDQILGTRDKLAKGEHMGTDSGASTPLWTTVKLPNFPALDQDIQTEVCVIGAGIAGLTTAFLLAREGKSVVVVDDGPLAGGQTGRTTAHLANAIDDRYFEIERIHGSRGAQLAYQSHTEAIQLIETIVQREKIECDFERLDGYLFVPPGEDHTLLERELEAAHRAGFHQVKRVARVPWGAYDTGPALRFPGQAQFHILKYLGRVAQLIVELGGQVYCSTHASEQIEAGAPTQIETDTGYSITAQHVVVATNSPINDRWADLFAIHMRQAAYRTFALAARVPLGHVNKGLYWDTADPYHYVRLQAAPLLSDGREPSYEYLIVGGEDHKTGQADDADVRYARLEAWTKERFPMIEDVEYRWSGQVQEPADGLALIGSNPGDSPNIHIITGDSGMGMTHGTIGAMIITDAIMERENAWATLYAPTRRMSKFLVSGEILRENLNVVAQAVDFITGGEVDNVDQIAPGEGAVVGHGLTKVATYRDQAGELHERSALCTHLQCVVTWNSEEKSWDCPCHGSRFDAYGRVIDGPAAVDLAPMDEKAQEQPRTRSPR
jgi:glycine/D-amino acid oxidase-like deaminating enzyme/nitrite reductase/ring-hydroxylating ferredoxin subunit